MMTMTSALIVIMLTNILMMFNMTISKKSINDREKSSPFECGFDPKSSSRTPFSLKFFLIAIIFLIFDIEIALLLPLIPTMMTLSMKEWMMTTMPFLIILILGVYHEWNQGALNWTT
uniref:NADH-ubiquinone oxidoreductase chain 3 n=1 Tax=Megalophasma granulatum TaxID=2042296 RepID=A0A343KJT7_9NEOP|nr:NADH dehydrogenase subunit 3 [Megalophasma granulatum]